MTGQTNDANEAEGPGKEYPVARPDPESVDRQPAVYPVYHEPGPEPPAEERFQFSLAEMLAVTAVVAFVLGLVSYLPGGYTGKWAVAGVGVLATMVVLELVGVTRPIARLGWWVMFVLYLLICVMVTVAGR